TDFCPRQGPARAFGSHTPGWGKPPAPVSPRHPGGAANRRWCTRSGKQPRSWGLAVGEPAAPPQRQRNAERRSPEYLTPPWSRPGGRSGLASWPWRSASRPRSPRLRVGELCALTWDQVDFGQGLLYVTRLKHGVPSVHPLGGEELRALRRVRREHP